MKDKPVNEKRRHGRKYSGNGFYRREQQEEIDLKELEGVELDPDVVSKFLHHRETRASSYQTRERGRGRE